MSNSAFVGKSLKFIIASATVLIVNFINYFIFVIKLEPGADKRGTFQDIFFIIPIAYIIGSGMIGAILPEKWYISIIANSVSLPLSMFLLLFLSFDAVIYSIDWLHSGPLIKLMLYFAFGLPLISLASGYAGALISLNIQDV